MAAGSGPDERMMLRCLELAATAQGRTSPNPMVGAVVLDRQGRLAGEGCHEKAGRAHAEVVALDRAGDRAEGGTLYVNLEPCSHTGRTPPCANRVVASHVRRVVVGMQDPNPQVCGQGIARLKAAGIEVEFSSLADECRELNRAFSKRMQTGLPWLSLKLASTLDGRIADRHGNSRWISGSEARLYVHQLRNIYDCVLIGGVTAAIDDPQLNVREIAGSRNPVKAVIDPDLKVQPQARLCRQEAGSESWTAIFSSPDRVKTAGTYPDRVRIVEITDGKDGNSFLQQSLAWLAEHDVQTVLCEGGGRLAAALLEEGLVDEVHWIIAARLFVDSMSVPALSGSQPRPIASCLDLEAVSYLQLGRDMLVTGRPAKPDSKSPCRST
jgi:diaminohydroxyphosphoribosylaminopyrimidine deaminase / 5-amino-6-(5-phosphoribosylamino)uracil reductase